MGNTNFTHLHWVKLSTMAKFNKPKKISSMSGQASISNNNPQGSNPNRKRKKTSADNVKIRQAP